MVSISRLPILQTVFCYSMHSAGILTDILEGIAPGEVKHVKKVNKRLDRLAQRWPLVRFIRDAVMVFLDRRVSRSGAELAYYSLMSVFPLLIFILGVIGKLPLTDDQVMSVLHQVLPEQVFALIEEYVSYVLNNLSSALLYTGLITTITAASAAFRGLISISGEIYGRRVFRGVQYWLFSILYSVLLLVFIYLTMIIVLTGTWFLRLLNSLLIIAVPAALWNGVRALFLFAVAMVFLMLLYRITSPGGKGRPPVLPGAFLASLALTLFSALFSLVITLSSRYSMVYGSLASIIILMVWLYFCGNIVVLGNVINYVRWRHKQGKEVELVLESVL